MPTERASAAEALYLAKTQGSRVGTIRGEEVNADLNLIVTKVTLVGDESANDVITLTPPLKQGQVPVPALCKVVTPSSLGTALSVKVGIDTDDDLICGATAIQAAGVIDNLGTNELTYESIATGKELIATVTTATSLTADATATFYIVTRSV
jgi:hypothetical protein